MGFRQSLHRVYWWCRNRIAPGFVYPQEVYERVLSEAISPQSVWLDLGCGRQILPSWRAENERELSERCRFVVGVDYDMPSLLLNHTIDTKVRADASLLPFQDDTFDLVTANMVVEHLDNPRVQFREISRVLKPSGKFIFHTPNALGYFAILRRATPEFINKHLVRILDGRVAADVFPIQYKANTWKQIDELAAESSFEVADGKLVSSDAVFSLIPPLMIFELLWIRALMSERLKSFRTNIIGVLRKRPL